MRKKPIKEATVINKIKTIFKKNFKNPIITKIHVTPLHNRGFPDLLVVTEYGVFFIEVKRPGNKPTPIQRATLVDFKNSGKDSIYCYWADCDKHDSNLVRFMNPKSDRVECVIPVR